ncbi:MAG: proton-conducting transporter membrane subunit [Bacteroidales bacterium]
MIILLLLIPFLGGVLQLFFTKNERLTKILMICILVINLLVSTLLFIDLENNGILVMQAGDWPAPFGITLVMDYMSAIMIFITAIVSLVSGIYVLKAVPGGHYKYRFGFMVSILLMGVNGAYLTADVFNLYVWYEVLLMASFVMIALGNTRRQLRGAIKYVAMNIVASFLLLAGAGIIYGKTGSLNMAHIAHILDQSDVSKQIASGAMLFFVSFGIKAAIFPFFFWLPSAYHTPPVGITAIFAGLMTKVGVYSLIRFFSLFMMDVIPFSKTVLLVVAGLTMVIGVFTAASQYDIRRILSFHIISQVGYMIMGLALFSVTGVAGAIYFMVHNILAKTNTFFIGGISAKICGTYDVKKSGGLFKLYPHLGFLFLISGLALAGIPPLSGFFGKFVLIKSGFELGEYVISFVAIFVSLITLFSMLKIWNEVFWKPAPEQSQCTQAKVNPGFFYYFPVVFLSILIVAMGVGAEPVFYYMEKAAMQLLDKDAYIKVVLRPGG